MRKPDDVSSCVELMRNTHLASGYPVHWPAEPDEFLVSSKELGAWIALDADGQTIGHVAVHDAEGDPAFGPVRAAASATAKEFVVIARLIVEPDRQGEGIGAALLGVASDYSKRTGRHPILDVVTSSTAAIAFYEAREWQRVGSVEIELSGQPNLSTWVYAAPGFWAAASPAFRALKAESAALAEVFSGLSQADLCCATRCQPWTVHTLAGHIIRGIERTIDMLYNAHSEDHHPNSLIYYQSPLRSDPTRNTKRNDGAAATAARFTSGVEIALALEEAIAAIEDAVTRVGNNVAVTTHWGPVMRAEDYLVTRVVELAVHGIDVADSLRLRSWLTPEAEHVLTTLIMGLAGRSPASFDSLPATLIRLATGREQSDAQIDGFPVIT